MDATNAMSDSEFGSSYAASDGTVIPMNANGSRDSLAHYRRNGLPPT